MKTIGDLGEQSLAALRIEDAARSKSGKATSGTAASTRLPHLAAAVPAEAFGCHPDWELEAADRRIAECARCPSHGGACKDALVPADLDSGRVVRWTDKLVTEKCTRWEEHVLRQRLEGSGVPRLLVGATLANYDPSTEHQREALERVREFVVEVKRDRDRERPHSLYLDGPTGVGKSHLAAAAVRELSLARRRCAFVYLPHLLELMRRAAAIGAPTEVVTVLERIETADLLVLDDLGAERPGNDFVRERLESLVHARTYGALATLVTTNRDLGRLEDRLGRPVVRMLAPTPEHVAFVDGEPWTETETP